MLNSISHACILQAVHAGSHYVTTTISVTSSKDLFNDTKLIRCLAPRQDSNLQLLEQNRHRRNYNILLHPLNIIIRQHLFGFFGRQLKSFFFFFFFLDFGLETTIRKKKCNTESIPASNMEASNSTFVSEEGWGELGGHLGQGGSEP